ncbi:MAG: maleylpyruvate isomerase family mycothiol-dependent enzyme [Carbonactinosporaceae bacterium]
MTTDVFDRESVLAELQASTERLLVTAEGFDDDDITAPSLLPGWTRGHVLTHVARNADALGNLVSWARTGVESPMYPSRESRDRDIDEFAARTAGEHAADLRDSAAALDASARDLAPDLWSRTVRTMQGREVPASEALWMRMKELEIHHVDLGSGYSPAHWSPAFVARALPEVAHQLGARAGCPAIVIRAEERDRALEIAHRAEPADGTADRTTDDAADDAAAGAPTVSGPEAALLAWLTGRSPGDGLTVEPAGPLPTLPVWL